MKRGLRMTNNRSIPYIYRKNNSEVFIIGEPENLIALGEMLVLKGKMNTRFSATMKDSDNNTIKVLTGDELEYNMRGLI